jgi:hypothetical protein
VPAQRLGEVARSAGGPGAAVLVWRRAGELDGDLIQGRIRRGRNVALLRGFFDELHATQPDDLRYAVFQLDDQVSFVHLAHTEQGAGPLPMLPAYRRFRATVEQRCDEPPVMTELHEIGSFHFR